MWRQEGELKKDKCVTNQTQPSDHTFLSSLLSNQAVEDSAWALALTIKLENFGSPKLLYLEKYWGGGLLKDSPFFPPQAGT